MQMLDAKYSVERRGKPPETCRRNARQCGSEERINTKQENAKTETMDKNEMTMQLQLEMKM
jgi:hypothetical protein